MNVRFCFCLQDDVLHKMGSAPHGSKINIASDLDHLAAAAAALTDAPGVKHPIVSPHEKVDPQNMLESVLRIE